ncbi:MAG TPA: alpha/beta fold hydrolase [Candidatus Limnocylindrales bacterium]|nr:alpha/beta fold hydrolase [Candidatus Limnocylindrales bacterium]
MATFLLLHGSWHGAWCWHKIVPRLESEGHRAIAIDLPGRGRAPAPAPLVGLGAMVRACERALPAGAKTTVVVHSRYGIVASALAERAPERIERTIYLASFLLASGKRVLDYVPDHDSMMPANVVVSRLAMWDWLKPSAYREALYADCTDDDVALASSLLVREPVRPALSRLRLTDDRYGRVPRAYIRLTDDRAVSPALQDRLLGETEVERVESLAAGHSAYFSQPDLLTKTILRLAGS